MLSIAGKCIEWIKGQIERIRFQYKLKRMDDEWFLSGRSCWELFPPSFYYTHTEEEVKRIKEETIKRLYEKIEKME